MYRRMSVAVAIVLASALLLVPMVSDEADAESSQWRMSDSYLLKCTITVDSGGYRTLSDYGMMTYYCTEGSEADLMLSDYIADPLNTDVPIYYGDIFSGTQYLAAGQVINVYIVSYGTIEFVAFDGDLYYAEAVLEPYGDDTYQMHMDARSTVTVAASFTDNLGWGVSYTCEYPGGFISSSGQLDRTFSASTGDDLTIMINPWGSLYCDVTLDVSVEGGPAVTAADEEDSPWPYLALFLVVGVAVVGLLIYAGRMDRAGVAPDAPP